MNTFSFSRLNKFLSCPAAFYAAYVAGVEEEPTYPLVLGKAVHSTIEAAMSFYREDEEFFRVMSKLVAENAPLNIDPEEVFKLAYQDIVLREISTKNSIEIEKHVTKPLGNDIYFQGYIDLLKDTEIIDWKTNWKEYNPTDNHQLALYAWCLGKPLKGKLVFLRWGNIIEHHYKQEEIEQAREWALGIARDIQERLHKLEQEPKKYPEIFPATPGETCQYCGYAQYCIEYPLPDPEDVDNYEKARDLGAEIVRLESALSDMKKKLQEYVETCGPVVLDKKKYVSQSDTYWTWDTKAKKEALKAMIQQGKEPFEFFNLTGSQLKKLDWGEQFIAGLGAQKKERKPRLRLVNRED